MKLPLMLGVVSSNIKEVGYDSASKQLFVRFSNGSVFMYDQVPFNVYEDMTRAESVGRYFKGMIQGAYVSTKGESAAAAGMEYEL
jgi:hypothetical protein